MNQTSKKYSAALYFLLAVFFFQGILFIYRKSATADEPAHIPAGWTYWKHLDFRMNPEHPPFIKMWCAIPLLFLDLKADYSESWRKSDEWRFGHDFIFKQNTGKPIIPLARIMNLLLGVLCCIILWMFTKNLFDEKIALIAVALYVFNPEMIAHSSLVTTDLGNCLFYLSAFSGLHIFISGDKKKGGMILFISLSLGHVTKHSFVMALPILLTWILMYSIKKTKSANTGRKGRELKAAILTIILMCFSIFLTIRVIYAVKYKSIPDGAEYLVNWEKFHIKGIKGDVINTLRKTRILPEAYIYGWNDVLKKGERQTFIWGKKYPTGVWFYFPSTFMLKTPLPLLLLLLIAAFFKLAKMPERKYLIPKIVWLPPLYYILFFIFLVRLNIGNRHILPVYPFVFIISAASLGNMSLSKIGKAASFIVLILYILTSIAVAPNYISFVNSFGGGIKNGWKMFCDSNIDWGQDLKELKKWSDENGKPHIYLSYFGNDDPTLEGLNYTLIPSFTPYYYSPQETIFNIGEIPLHGYFAISATHLSGMYLDEYNLGFNPYEYFRDKKPYAVAGASLFIFREDSTPVRSLLDADIAIFKNQIRENPEAGRYYTMLAGALMHKGVDIDMRIKSLSDAIAMDKDNVDNMIALAKLFIRIGIPDRAEVLFKSVLEKTPKNFTVWNELGNLYLEQGKYNEAEASLLQSVEIIQEYLPAWNNLALVYIGMKDEKKFKNAAENIKALEPDSYICHNLSAQFYMSARNYKNAIAEYEKAVKLKPDFAAGFNNLGYLLYEDGKTSEALTAYKTACNIDPTNTIFKENYEALKREIDESAKSEGRKK